MDWNGERKEWHCMAIRLFAVLLLLFAPSLASAAFPTGWTGYATHSVTTEPASNLTDFTFFVSLNQLPSTFWTEVQTDGDDIRVTSDAAGTTELPVDIILFTDSGSSGSGLIAVKYSGTKSSSVDQKIYIWAGNASATRPGDTDTYGRENAYASHWRAFWPSGAGTDRTQYDNDLTMTGSPTDGGTAGPINGSTATDYNGSSQYGTSTVSVPTAVPITLLVSGRPDADTVTYLPLAIADTAGANEMFDLRFSGALAGDKIEANSKAGGVNAVATSATGFTVSTYCRAVAKFSSSTSRDAAINGTFGSANTTSSVPSSIDTISVGAAVRNTVSSHFDGRLSMVQVHDVALSADWVAYDSAVLADPDQSDFFGTWSWTATAASARDPLSATIPGVSRDPLTGTIPGL